MWSVILLLSVFSVTLHLGFASATGLASTLIPIFIAFTSTLPYDKSTMFGIIFVQSMVVSFGFILPTNAPQNMLCVATGAFNTTQFVKVGLMMTIIGLLIITVIGRRRRSRAKVGFRPRLGPAGLRGPSGAPGSAGRI